MHNQAVDLEALKQQREIAMMQAVQLRLNYTAQFMAALLPIEYSLAIQDAKEKTEYGGELGDFSVNAGRAMGVAFQAADMLMRSEKLHNAQFLLPPPLAKPAG